VRSARCRPPHRHEIWEPDGTRRTTFVRRYRLEQVRAAGVEVEPPEDKPYRVRMLTVTDPVGYQWGFMRRTA
jgi:hypothetical protein